MPSIYDLYKEFPKADCGYCGNTSCIAALRKHCAGEMKLSECIYFKSGECNESDFKSPAILPKTDAQPGISYVNPCPSDSGRVTVEVSLTSPENLKYGVFDMVTADKIFGQIIPYLKISPSLGLARFDYGDMAVMAFSEGRVLVRRALNQEDAFWQLSNSIRKLWAATN